MKNNINLKLLLAFFASSLIFSCSPRNSTIDFDFTTLKKSKKNELNNKKIKNKDSNEINLENNNLIKDLVPLKNKQEILSKIKFGKKDPFSKGEIQSNKILKDFILKGFLNTKNNNYVFVSYLGEKGTVSEESIGGVNTTLLPNGAKVVTIDPKNLELIINFENKNYILKL